MDKLEIKKPRILVVEDEEFLRRLYVDLLKTEGYEVDEAKDGEEGYQKIGKESYDLILLDYLLPKMDGEQILNKLKAELPDKDLNNSIVILSNMDQDVLSKKSFPFIIKGYVVKSNYTPDQFVSEVKRYLDS